MTANQLSFPELPLLGSNQDSPDPESGERLYMEGVDGPVRVEYKQGKVRTIPEAPTISHTPRRRGQTLEYHREWRKTPSGKESLKASQRAFQARHPERVAAHRIVNEALRRGRITKGPCEFAGSDCKWRIEAHHDDYTKPLEVRWLCKKHHKAADQSRRREDVA